MMSRCTYSSGLSPGEQEIEAFTRKAIHRLLRLRHRFGLHQVGEDSTIFGVVKSGLDILRDHNVHLMHDRFDILAHVVGQQRKNLSHLATQSVVPHHVGTAEEGLDPGSEVWLPAFLSNEAHRFTESVLRDHIGRETIECFFDIEGFFSSRSQHLVDGHLSKLVHFSLELQRLLTREELGQRALTHPVDFMVDSREAGHRNGSSTASVQLMLPFVANTSWASIDLVSEVRI